MTFDSESDRVTIRYSVVAADQGIVESSAQAVFDEGY